METRSAQSFTHLEVWQEGHKLVLGVYRAAKSFPKEELFALVSQMRRAAVSVTSNIAEGFARTSYREKAQFYQIARGSLVELQNQLLISRDIGYLSKKAFSEVSDRSIVTHRLLNAFIKSTIQKQSK